MFHRQHNSGDKKRPGNITKTGNGHVRRALRARAKITLHFKRRCILSGCVTKA
ncbi:MAG: transposase [Desulfosarcina sp.]|nr:transposase [Desulfobacterales bacterium]